MASARWLVVLGCILAAAGQVALKLGAAGAIRIQDFVNVKVFVGLGLYAVGSALWLVALSKLPLSAVYPFTAFTFVLVYSASIVVLGEKVTPNVLLGSGVVLLGLLLISMD